MTTQHPPDAGQVNVNVGTGGGAASTAPVALSVARRILTLLFAALIALIALRVVVCLLGASADAPMVGFITSTTDVFVAPFESVFNIEHVTPSGEHATLDVAAVVALVAYSLILALVLALLALPGRGARTAA